MNKKQIIQNAQKAVDVLVGQYHDDLALIASMDRLKAERIAKAAQLSKTSGVPLRDVLRGNEPALQEIDTKIATLKTRQQTLWDGMFYDSPVIWLMYKYQAYRASQNEIATMGNLKKHCEPVAYICTKRFIFMHNYALHNIGVDILEIPDDALLPEIYKSDWMMQLVNDPVFMQTWREHEYYKEGGHVAKWQSFKP
jgi:hypothetical protein